MSCYKSDKSIMTAACYKSGKDDDKSNNKCKMANLVLTTLLSWLGKKLSMNRKSHVMGHMITLQILGTLKSFAFGEITKKYLIDSTLWVGLMRVITWGDHVR